MKSYYVKDLTASLALNNEPFAIAEVSKAEDKFGKPYLKLILADKTGKVEAKIWNDKLIRIDQKICVAGSIVLVTAKVEEFKGKMQINIADLKKADENKLDEFIESSIFDADEMMAELENYVNGIKHNSLRGILQEMFLNENFKRSYRVWPAAKSVHHDFRSGLLQHVLEMLTIAHSMKRFYPMVNYDILTAGIILHDIGKFQEFDVQGIGTEYSKKGILAGHIPLGAMEFQKYAQGKLSEDLYYHMIHMILAHHGEVQYGSPVVPATIEAVMLAYIDRLSDKARCAVQAVEDITEDREFGNYNIWMENARFWRGGNYDELTEPEATSKEAEEDPIPEIDIKLVTDEKGDQLVFKTGGDNE
jgi:3'-5' exoribonuclease